jgi:hypothetical protein
LGLHGQSDFLVFFFVVRTEDFVFVVAGDVNDAGDVDSGGVK